MKNLILIDVNHTRVFLLFMYQNLDFSLILLNVLKTEPLEGDSPDDEPEIRRRCAVMKGRNLKPAPPIISSLPHLFHLLHSHPKF